MINLTLRLQIHFHNSPYGQATLLNTIIFKQIPVVPNLKICASLQNQ